MVLQNTPAAIHPAYVFLMLEHEAWGTDGGIAC